MSNRSRIPRTSPEASRPNFPKDYGILGEDAGYGLLPWSRVGEQLEASRNYWIHTTRPDGRPHVKPVWGLWFEQRFYFATSPQSITGRNIGINPSLSVNLESGNDVVILEGTAEVVTDPTFLSRLDEAYYQKYSYHLVHEDGGPVYALRHKAGFAWRERDFTGSATKYDFQF
jgi:hypothetical protein